MMLLSSMLLKVQVAGCVLPANACVAATRLSWRMAKGAACSAAQPNCIVAHIATVVHFQTGAAMKARMHTNMRFDAHFR